MKIARKSCGTQCKKRWSGVLDPAIKVQLSTTSKLFVGIFFAPVRTGTNPWGHGPHVRVDVSRHRRVDASTCPYVNASMNRRMEVPTMKRNVDVNVDVNDDVGAEKRWACREVAWEKRQLALAGKCVLKNYKRKLTKHIQVTNTSRIPRL